MVPLRRTDSYFPNLFTNEENEKIPLLFLTPHFTSILRGKFEIVGHCVPFFNIMYLHFYFIFLFLYYSRTEGGIPPLVMLLDSVDPKVQRAGAGALRTLAFKNELNKNQVSHPSILTCIHSHTFVFALLYQKRFEAWPIAKERLGGGGGWAFGEE